MVKTILNTRGLSLFLILLTGTLVSSASAQGMMGMMASPESRAAAQTERMKKDLSLTEKQEKKVSELNNAFAKKAIDAFQSASGREERRETMAKLNDERNKELKKILTKEQYELHLKLQEERRRDGSRNQ